MNAEDAVNLKIEYSKCDVDVIIPLLQHQGVPNWNANTHRYKHIH